MSAQAEEGPARISLSGGDNALAEFNNRAVLTLGIGGEGAGWTIKALTPSDDSPPFYMILLNSKDSEQRCLTLDTNAGENENNVMVEALETPMPKTSQLWTFEEAAVMERLPPILLARIQSVARPGLSAAIGGNVPLPRLYQNIAGVMNDPGSKSQRWKLDYMLVDE